MLIGLREIDKREAEQIETIRRTRKAIAQAVVIATMAWCIWLQFTSGEDEALRRPRNQRARIVRQNKRGDEEATI
jgi:hypothetical protein